ncbi:hypothetical protein AMECASPLE_037391, partial [Ameca splendens]
IFCDIRERKSLLKIQKHTTQFHREPGGQEVGLALDKLSQDDAETHRRNNYAHLSLSKP